MQDDLTGMSDDNFQMLALSVLGNCHEVFSPEQFAILVNKVAIKKGILKGYDEGSGIGYAPHSYKHDRRSIDALQDYFIYGYVRMGIRGFSELHVTEHGRHIASQGRVTPYDPSGYLSQLTSIQNFDPTMLEYITESIQTLRAGRIISSIVTLGVASERGYNLFLDQFLHSVSPSASQKKAVAILDKWNIHSRYKAFNDNYKDCLTKALTSSLGARSLLVHNYDTYMTAIFINIKSYRNDAGHADLSGITKKVAEDRLIIFPDYIRFLYELIDWLSKNNVTV